MKIPRLKKGQIVEVLWEDTHIPQNPGWMTEAEHSEWATQAGSLVQSVGVFVGKDKNFIRLIGDRDADDASEMNYLRPINIGRGFIREIHVLGRIG